MLQDRVRNEVNTVMQESEGKLTMKSLQNLHLLERCIKESLRLYPSAFVISRVTGEDVKLRMYLQIFLLYFFNTLFLLLFINCLYFIVYIF